MKKNTSYAIHHNLSFLKLNQEKFMHATAPILHGTKQIPSMYNKFPASALHFLRPYVTRYVEILSNNHRIPKKNNKR
jgi:hypothetical protein